MNNHMICALVAGVAVAALTVSVEAAGDPAKGKIIYDGIGACSACHGPEGKGDGAASAALDPKPRSFAGGKFLFDTEDADSTPGSAADIKNVISKGAKAYKGSLMMAARPDIKGADLDNLVAYVMELAGK